MLGVSFGPAQDIEILWTAVAAIGFLYSLLSVRDAEKDLDVVNTLGITNGRKLIAQTALYTEVCRLLIQAIFVVLGALVLYNPAPPPAADLTLIQETTAFLVRWGLMTASGMLIFKTWLTRRARHALIG